MCASAPKAREGVRAPGAVVKTVLSLPMRVPNFGPLEEEGLSSCLQMCRNKGNARLCLQLRLNLIRGRAQGLQGGAEEISTQSFL